MASTSAEAMVHKSARLTREENEEVAVVVAVAEAGTVAVAAVGGAREEHRRRRRRVPRLGDPTHHPSPLLVTMYYR